MVGRLGLVNYSSAYSGKPSLIPSGESDRIYSRTNYAPKHLRSTSKNFGLSIPAAIASELNKTPRWKRNGSRLGRNSSRSGCCEFDDAHGGAVFLKRPEILLKNHPIRKQFVSPVRTGSPFRGPKVQKLTPSFWRRLEGASTYRPAITCRRQVVFVAASKLILHRSAILLSATRLAG